MSDSSEKEVSDRGSATSKASQVDRATSGIDQLGITDQPPA